MASVKYNTHGFLIILGGLPGTGKTTIARSLSQKIKATHIRIDTIETSLRHSFSAYKDINDAGYKVAYDIAKDNLRLGMPVITDSVNALELSREAWRTVAQDTQSTFIEIELICSDTSTHKNRIMTRDCDILGLCPPYLG